MFGSSSRLSDPGSVPDSEGTGRKDSERQLELLVDQQLPVTDSAPSSESSAGKLEFVVVQHRSRLPLAHLQQVALAITALVQVVTVGLPVVLGNFTASSITTPNVFVGVKSVLAIDINNDGRPDVVCVTEDYVAKNVIWWYRNEGGTSSALNWSPFTIDGGTWQGPAVSLYSAAASTATIPCEAVGGRWTGWARIWPSVVESRRLQRLSSRCQCPQMASTCMQLMGKPRRHRQKS
jgi:hypothetical protein